VGALATRGRLMQGGPLTRSTMEGGVSYGVPWLAGDDNNHEMAYYDTLSQYDTPLSPWGVQNQCACARPAARCTIPRPRPRPRAPAPA